MEHDPFYWDYNYESHNFDDDFDDTFIPCENCPGIHNGWQCCYNHGDYNNPNDWEYDEYDDDDYEYEE